MYNYLRVESSSPSHDHRDFSKKNLYKGNLAVTSLLVDLRAAYTDARTHTRTTGDGMCECVIPDLCPALRIRRYFWTQGFNSSPAHHSFSTDRKGAWH